MTPPRKVALVAHVWTTWQHRFMAGALRYADAHPRILLRSFAPARDAAAVARDLEAWGAQGVLAHMGHDELSRFLGALSRRLPVVNGALARQQPGVVALVGDFAAFVEAAVGHLRQLGLRALAILVLEEGPEVREHLVRTFLRVARPPAPERASLVFPADSEHLWNCEAAVAPVPPPLAEWLCALPKPVGILCPTHGGGGYLIRCCHALGLRVPEDVAIVGADDTDLSLAVEPTLTSVILPAETVGFEALRLLTGLLAGEVAPAPLVRLRCLDLQVRESTGKRRPEICDIAGALECIRENACRGLTVEQVIRQTQRVSKVTFHRRFQAVVGKSPAEAIRERRLEEVRRLLASTELPLATVSDLCGFSSPKVLARLFRATLGTTPREFRSQGQRALAARAAPN